MVTSWIPWPRAVVASSGSLARAAQLPASSKHTNNRGDSIPSGWRAASSSARVMMVATSSSNSGRNRPCSLAGAYRYKVLAPERSASTSRSQPSADSAMTGSANTSSSVSAVPYTLPRVLSGRARQADQGVQGHQVTRLLQRLGDLVLLLDVHPPGDVAHRPIRQRRREKRRTPRSLAPSSVQ